MSSRIIKPTLFRQDECLLGEGPFWYDKQFWWVDIEGGKAALGGHSGKSDPEHLVRQTHRSGCSGGKPNFSGRARTGNRPLASGFPALGNDCSAGECRV